MTAETISDHQASTLKARRRSLLRSAFALWLATFLAFVAVQLADVSLTGDLATDLILVVGATQVGMALWTIQLLGCRWGGGAVKNLLLFAGQEAGLFIIMMLSVSWPAIDRGPEGFRSQSSPARTSGVNASAATPHDFPAFRGKDRIGTIRNIKLARESLDRTPTQRWRTEVGTAWSSFAVVGNVCVTQEQRGQFEAIVCYELQSGRECWAQLNEARVKPTVAGDGPRATPAIHQGRVYALGATGILDCLDGSTGRRIWSVNILRDNDAPNRMYGMACSPLVIEPYVIVSPGGAETSLVAYDWETGEKRWSGGSAEGSYSSPQPGMVCGEPQITLFHGDGIDGHSLVTGEVLWSYPWVSNPVEKNNVCQPVILPHGTSDDSSLVFIASGYGQGCALLQVDRGNRRFTVHEKWSNRNLKAKFTSVVVREGHVYGLDERILTCLDLETGERRWNRGRFGFGQLILVDDVLVIQAETGDVAFVEATPTRFHELGRFKALDGRTWNHPVLAGAFLLVRNDREAACYELPLARK